MNPRNKGQRERIQALRTQIADLHRLGWSRASIANITRLTPPTVGYHAKALGLSWPIGRTKA